MTKSAEKPDCPKLLHAAADKTRFAILMRLMKSPCHVSELNEIVQIEQSLLSHHLKVLRDSGLITSRRDGKAVLYDLAEETRVDGEGINFGCCRLDFPD